MSNNRDSQAHLGLIAMANDVHNPDGLSYQQERQQFHRGSRVGLLPTDGYEAHKKLSARSSRRSRAERTSYLVATGHLDPEETKQLNLSGDEINYSANISHSPTRDQHNNFENHTKSYRTNRNFRIAEPTIKSSNQSFDVDQSPLNEITDRNDIQFQELRLEEAFRQPKLKGGTKKYKNDKLSPYGNQLVSRSGPTYVVNGDHQDDSRSRAKFRQTYTEVSLPMKTSPAFEYILKDNHRRNKRYCMWLLYSILVTMCLAIIAFSSVHLIMRYRNST